jgi:hypothetical protein
MYTRRFIQYLNLPRIPQELVDRLPGALDRYHQNFSYKSYTWSDSWNHEIDQWCKENICADMYFGFQFMDADLEPHTDIGTLTKINYVISTGGTQVITRFHEQDRVVAEHVIDPNRWHILKADTAHSVAGIEPGCLRWAVTGRIF